MRLSDLMELEILTISANDYAIEALRLMSQRQAAWIIVLEGDRIGGVVFAHELVNVSEVTLKERDVREYSHGNLLMISGDEQPQEAERLLRRSGVDFLTVVRDNQPIGIVTQETLIHGPHHQKQAS